MRWKSISGFPGYQVSNTGLVRSTDRVVNYSGGVSRKRKGQLLCSGISKNGYGIVVLGRGNPMYVHHLVVLAFRGEATGAGMEINHKDGDKLNNRLSNLALGTQKANNEHAITNGFIVIKRGEDSNLAKLKKKEVKKILSLKNSGLTHFEIGSKFGVSRATIGDIFNGKSWAHLSGVRRAIRL